jgi:hypothetical protein
MHRTVRETNNKHSTGSVALQGTSAMQSIRSCEPCRSQATRSAALNNRTYAVALLWTLAAVLPSFVRRFWLRRARRSQKRRTLKRGGTTLPQARKLLSEDDRVSRVSKIRTNL